MNAAKHRLAQTVDGFWQVTFASKDKPDNWFMDAAMGAALAVGLLAEDSNNPFGFEAKKHRINQNISGDWHLTLTSLELPDWLVHTAPGVGLDLRMTPIDYDNPEVNLDEEAAKRYVTRSVMLSKDPLFQDFIDVNDESGARDWICARLGIESRADLRTDIRAQHKLDDLIDGFRNKRHF